MISGIGPERTPNGDFGGRSFQGVGGPPTSLRGAPVPFPGAPNKPGSDIGEPNIMRDTAGRRSNATVQYSRVVPMGSKAQKLETEGLQPGVLAWTSNDERMQKRAGRGVERMYKLTSWNWLQSEVMLQPPPQGGAVAGRPPRAPGDLGPRQRHAVRDGGTGEVGVELTAGAAEYFQLNRPAMVGGVLASPYLMWGPRDGALPIRSSADVIDNTEYDMLNPVRTLWHVLYETPDDDDREEAAFRDKLRREDLLLPEGLVPPRLLSREVMGGYTPDGFVLYKYSTEGADSVAEGELDDAQNGLFNIVVGGHALVTSWAVFDPVERPYGAVQGSKKSKRLVTMPRDTLFIVVKGRWLKNGDDDGGWFVDLRYVRSTSEELMRNSTNTRRLGPDTNVDLKEDEFVLGAWRIGSVIDSAASRTRPSSFATAPVTPTQAMGLTVSVGIHWVTSYALHDMFHQREVIAEPPPRVVAAERERRREDVAREAAERRVAADEAAGAARRRRSAERDGGRGGMFGATTAAAAPGTAGFRGAFRFGAE